VLWALFVFFSLAAVTVVWVRRLRETFVAPRRDPFLSPEPGAEGELPVSVIIPARNEEATIGACVESLLRQPARPAELLVVDDRSTDGTAQAVKEAAGGFPQLKILANDGLPEGWTGKNRACHVGFEAADQPWLLFTDADTVHARGSLAAALAFAEEHKLDALSLLPRLEARSFWERVVQPMVGGICVLWYPARKVNDPYDPAVFANGQYFLISREAYFAIGGHEACRGALLEDVAMARALKRNRRRFFLGYGPAMVTTRMYTRFRELWAGWLRIFVNLFERRTKPALLGFVQVFFGGLWPFVWLVAGGGLTWLVAATACGLLLATLWRSYRLQGMSPSTALAAPLASLVLLGLMAHAAWVSATGGAVTWRGRAYGPEGSR
jgi:glycosyltransferase involved in cell wall biosynthesis